MNSQSYIWLDGNFLLRESAKIDLLTHGLHYGTGAFEGIRVYNGKIFKLIEHIDRLFNSAKILLMEIAHNKAEIMDACLEIVKLNNIRDGYIRPLIFLNNQNTFVGADNKVQTMIACWPRPNIYQSDLLNKKALNLSISPFIKPAPESQPYEAKASGLYLINHLAKRKAINTGYDDSLMIDYRGFIAEATTSNFFMVKNDILYTPLPECCLKGVTRQVVIDIAKENKIEVKESHLMTEELSNASEAFLTGTAAEITAISSIEQYKFNAGPVSKLIYQCFYQLTMNL